MAPVDGPRLHAAPSAWPARWLFLIVAGSLLLDVPLFVFAHVTSALPPKFLLVAVGVVALIAGVAREAASGRMLALGAAVVAYASVNVFALGWSANAEGATRELVTRVTGLAVLVLTAVVTSHARRRIAVRELVAALAVSAAGFCILDALNGYQWTSVPGRAAGSFVNPNAAASSIIFLAIAGLEGVPHARRPWYLLFTSLGALLTLSRGGYVMLLVSLIVLGIGALYSVRSLIRVAIVAALILVPVASIAVRTVLADRPEVALLRAVGPATLLRLGAGDARSTSERRQVAVAAAELFFEHPIRGAGLTATTAWTLPVSTHNEPLRVAAELGLVGLLFFASLLVTVFVVGRAYTGPAGAALVCWIAVLLSVSHNVLEGWSHLASLGLLAGGGQLGDEAIVRPEIVNP